MKKNLKSSLLLVLDTCTCSICRNLLILTARPQNLLITSICVLMANKIKSRQLKYLCDNGKERLQAKIKSLLLKKLKKL